MATKTGRTRIAITISNNVLEKLDKYCEQSGLSRSAVISDIVGTNLGVYERVTSTFERELANALIAGRETRD